MLVEMRIANFAIIEQLSLSFFPGFNILSGETGAGKSILMKSLGLLMGAKSSSSDVRQNQPFATVEGVFDIQKRFDIQDRMKHLGLPNEENNLIVRRRIEKNGKNRVYINGSLCSVGDLRQLVYPLVTLSNPVEAPLIEITGQHENRSLTSHHYQMDVLDQWSHSLETRERYQSIYKVIQDLSKRVTDIENKSQEREQKIDFLNFQIKEIGDLSLEEGEDELILKQIKELRGSENWKLWYQWVSKALNEDKNSVVNVLQRIVQETPNRQKESLQEFYTQIDRSIAELSEASFHLEVQQSNLCQSDPQKLDQLENRLSRIRKLQKKFGPDINLIQIQYTEMKESLKQLLQSSQLKIEIEKKIAQHSLELKNIASELSTMRSKGAIKFEQQMNKQFNELNMKGVEFKILLEKKQSSLQPFGQENIIFQLKNNKSDKARNLAKTASGGELSRILLAIKNILGKSDYPRTFLFDEVDTGVSGHTAERVGAKLHNLAQGQQVLCVTHLPQVAAFADRHFLIQKENGKSSTNMKVNSLEPKDQILEIARLISGKKVTTTSLEHAKQLLSTTR